MLLRSIPQSDRGETIIEYSLLSATSSFLLILLVGTSSAANTAINQVGTAISSSLVEPLPEGGFARPGANGGGTEGSKDRICYLHIPSGNGGYVQVPVPCLRP